MSITKVRPLHLSYGGTRCPINQFSRNVVLSNFMKTLILFQISIKIEQQKTDALIKDRTARFYPGTEVNQRLICSKFVRSKKKIFCAIARKWIVLYVQTKFFSSSFTCFATHTSPNLLIFFLPSFLLSFRLFLYTFLLFVICTVSKTVHLTAKLQHTGTWSAAAWPNVAQQYSSAPSSHCAYIHT